jgi:uncharacterized protein YggE
MRAALIAVVACAACSGALADSAPVSSIRVSADAKVTAKPDRVQIEIGVSTRAAQSQEAAQNARQVEAMLAAVHKAVPAALLKTVSYSLNPNYEYHASGGEPTVTGYTATNVVQVTLDDLEKIGGVIDAAAQAGANHVQGIQFTLRDQDAVRAEALREAATRARAQAEVLAAALGLKVVRVLSAEENSPRFMPINHPLAGRAAMSSAAVATPVEAGTLDVAAEVTLSVEVSPAAR